MPDLLSVPVASREDNRFRGLKGIAKRGLVYLGLNKMVEKGLVKGNRSNRLVAVVSTIVDRRGPIYYILRPALLVINIY